MMNLNEPFKSPKEFERSITIFIALIMLVMLAGIFALNGCAKEGRAETARERFDHSAAWESAFGWEFATVTDTETGVVYLVFRDHNVKSSVGGITPLLQRDGSVTIDERYAEKG